ncbi:MAG TPA: hypothetical protein VF533_04610 [Solirubrobacteraceae bacterium]|jgi:Tol biopolymer transport system component
MSPTTRRLLAAVVATAATLTAQPAGAESIPERTLRISDTPGRQAATGQSSHPSISPKGGLVAFDSTAPDLATDGNGPVRDVFLRDTDSGTTRLISAPFEGGTADGPSDQPALAGTDVVVFASTATNLVAGDRNGFADVFIRGGISAPVRISAPRRGEADGDSGQPDISRDGQVIVFSSTATNLVAGDTNGVSDIFAVDLGDGRLRRISVARGGEQATGASVNPSLSPDGRYVSFASAADDLVRGDRNGVADVFLADLETGRIERVSVDSRERAQNRAVVAPFTQVSDVSENARVVVFDSDATNLVRSDRNQDTDVFVRDRRSGTTRRASITTTGRQGTNDSFAPSVTSSGRYVAFESFADDMAPGDAGGEDIFVRDLRRKTTVVADVTSRGGFPRGPERIRQLLQRPAIADDARLVAFTSSADNLVAGDANRTEDVFVRVLAAPFGGFARAPRKVERTRRPRVRFVADDRAARIFLCSIDGVRRYCGRRTRLPRLKPGPHVLRASAGGPGMLYSTRTSVRRFRIAP